MKTTIAEYSDEAPVFSYEGIDVSLVEPRKRDYSKGQTKPARVQQPGSELKPEGREERWAKDAERVKQGESFKE